MTTPHPSRRLLEDFDFNEKAVVLFGETRISEIRPVLPVKTSGSLEHLLADVEHEVRRLRAWFAFDVQSAKGNGKQFVADSKKSAKTDRRIPNRPGLHVNDQVFHLSQILVSGTFHGHSGH